MRYAFANWKMNLPAEGIDRYFAALGEPDGRARVVVFPPFTHIERCARAPQATEIGAQDLSLHESGAHTGSVSATQISDVGGRWAIVGHSERRALDDDETVAAKLRRALESGLNAVLCVGEHADIRRTHGERNFVSRQLRSALDGLDAGHFGRIVVAYEPIWAIGTGVTPSPREIGDMRSFISDWLSPHDLSILYGGSVNGDNAPDFSPHVDGFLVGGASLKSDQFRAIIDALTRQTC